MDGMRSRGRPRRARSIAIGGLVALVGAFAALPASAGAQTDSTAVAFPGGPLTVYVGPLGECQSSYLVNGAVAGNYYYGGNTVGDCGFFLAFPPKGSSEQPKEVEGKTFGFDGQAGPHGLETYTPVEQTPVTGAGTEASPYTQTTVFKVLAELKEIALISETTTYVNGQPQFVSTYTVTNKAKAKIYFRAIYAGDLYVNGNDLGTGVFLGGPPKFIGGQNTGSGVLGGFIEAPAPALPWSAWQEAYWNNGEGYPGAQATDNGIWNVVEHSVEQGTAFNNTIEPLELDNGAGVEWDQYRATGLEKGAEASFSIINRTQIPTGLQISPATQTVQAGHPAAITVTSLDTANQPYAGKALRYTIGGANPQSGAVTLNAAGQAQIAYVPANAGIDTVSMYVDLPGTGTQTPSDPAGNATVTVTPAPTGEYKIQSIKANANGTITIVFVPTQSGQATVEVTVPTATISRREAEAARRKKCRKGQVLIKGKCRPPTTLSGKKVLAGSAGVPLTISVPASGRVKAALKKGRTVKLSVKLTYRSSLGGAPTVHTYTVTVKPKKKRKH